MGSHGRYARGHNALGHCGRCGDKVLLRKLMYDGQVSDLLVCRDCWDPKHPQEYLPDVSDPISLYHPSGDLDRASNKVVITLDQLTTRRQRSVGEESSIPVQAFPIGQTSGSKDTVSTNPMQVSLQVNVSQYQLKVNQDPAEGPQIAPPLTWPDLANEWVVDRAWREIAGEMANIKTSLGGAAIRSNSIGFSPDGTKFYMGGVTQGMRVYTLSTPYDPSTATLSSNRALGNIVTSRFIPNTVYNVYVTTAQPTDQFVVYANASQHEVSSGDTLIGVMTKTTAFGSNNSRDGVGFMSNDGEWLYYTGVSSVYQESLRNFRLLTPYDPTSYEGIPHSETNINSIHSTINSNGHLIVHPNGLYIYFLSDSRYMYKGTMTVAHDLSTITWDIANRLDIHTAAVNAGFAPTGVNWKSIWPDATGSALYAMDEQTAGNTVLMRFIKP